MSENVFDPLDFNKKTKTTSRKKIAKSPSLKKVQETTRIRRGKTSISIVTPKDPIFEITDPVPPTIPITPITKSTPITKPIPAIFAPPPPPKKSTTICDVLGTGNTSFGKRGTTVPRGVSFACGGQPIDFSTPFPNNTTVRIFGAQIQRNRAKVKAAGVTLPPSHAEKAGAKRRVKILRKKQRSCGRDTNCLVSFGTQIKNIEKTFGI